ncbi:threonylcarbamoyladenosine tRNA methylthiotransferase, partial [Lates japonicus]
MPPALSPPSQETHVKRMKTGRQFHPSAPPSCTPLAGHSVRLLGQKKDGGRRLGGARLDLPKIRRNPLIEIISINTGCLNACTYCKTKHARGDLASYPIEELVERARQSFQ